MHYKCFEIRRVNINFVDDLVTQLIQFAIIDMKYSPMNDSPM